MSVGGSRGLALFTAAMALVSLIVIPNGASTHNAPPYGSYGGDGHWRFGFASPISDQGGLVVCQQPHGPAPSYGIGGVCLVGATGMPNYAWIDINLHHGVAYQYRCADVNHNYITEWKHVSSDIQIEDRSYWHYKFEQPGGCAYVTIAMDAGQTECHSPFGSCHVRVWGSNSGSLPY